MTFLISLFSSLRREFKNIVSHMEVFKRNFNVSSTSEGFMEHTLRKNDCSVPPYMVMKPWVSGESLIDKLMFLRASS